MKLISTIILALGILTFMQDFDKVNFDPNLDHTLFSTTDSTLNPLTIRTKSGYDGLLDSNLYEIKSTAVVNGDTLRQMRFASAKRIDQDTLELKIYETAPLYHQELSIKIVGNRFQMNFDYDMSGPLINRRIKTLDQNLILKNDHFKEGEMMYGKFKFIGTCTEGSDEDKITIDGYFKTKIN